MFNPCPFCGSTEIATRLSDGDVHASCSCGCELTLKTYPQDNPGRTTTLIEAWNRRS